MAEGDRKGFIERLRGFETGMLVTCNAESEALRSRPMQVAHLEDTGDLWFITGEDTQMVAEIRKQPQVLLTFQDAGRYISLSGQAELVRDEARLDALWDDSFEAWFPEGKGDPKVLLIHVAAQDAEFWGPGGLNRERFAFQDGQTAPRVGDSTRFGHVELENR